MCKNHGRNDATVGDDGITSEPRTEPQCVGGDGGHAGGSQSWISDKWDLWYSAAHESQRVKYENEE